MSDEHESLTTADVIEIGAHYKTKRPTSNGKGGSLPSQVVVAAPGQPYENAKKFTKANHFHHERELLVHHGGAFEGWDGTCWPVVEDRALRADIYSYFADAVFLKTVGGETVKVPFDPTTRKVADIIDALKAHVHVSQHVNAPAWLDGKDPVPAVELISMENGLLHVATRKLFAHTPHFYVSWSLPYRFDDRAPAPARWLQFLDEIWGDDEESKQTLQELFGYLLSGDTKQQKLFMLVGPKRGGKGTVARVIGGLLGRHNVAGPTLSSLSTNFGLSPLIGKPVAVIADARLRSDDAVIVERLLSISGEDLLTVDRKYNDHWTGKLPTRFVLISNETPRLRDSSGALASRFVILTMSQSFYGREDKDLTDRLLAELPGILRWSLDGLESLRARGHFVQPKAALEVLQELEDLGSPMGAFVRDYCTVGAGCSVAVTALWDTWKSWCESQGRDRPGTVQTFGRDLRAVVPGLRLSRPRHDDQRYREYEGIRLGAPDGDVGAF